MITAQDIAHAQVLGSTASAGADSVMALMQHTFQVTRVDPAVTYGHVKLLSEAWQAAAGFNVWSTGVSTRLNAAVKVFHEFSHMGGSWTIVQRALKKVRGTKNYRSQWPLSHVWRIVDILKAAMKSGRITDMSNRDMEAVLKGVPKMPKRDQEILDGMADKLRRLKSDVQSDDAKIRLDDAADALDDGAGRTPVLPVVTHPVVNQAQ